LKVIHDDEETIRNLNTTHNHIADRLEHFLKVAPFGTPRIIDGNFEARMTAAGFGSQDCPWEDPAYYGGMNYSVKNLRIDETLSFPGLIVHLIREHHFYEGRKSPYRVNPKQAVRVLDIK